MATWRRKPDYEEPPAELLDFDPDHWIFAAHGKPERVRMALARWHEARWDCVMEAPHVRTIHGLDAVDLVWEDGA
jgi:hypothetical protein